MSNVVIGVGPPRSGTKSLSYLLHMQENARVSHEEGPGLPWEDPNPPATTGWVRRSRKKDFSLVGDVAYKWLPGLAHLNGETKVVALWREPSLWLESFLDVVDERWLRIDEEAPPRCRAFGGSAEERALMYRKLFYRRLNRSASPHVRVRTASLSEPDVQRRLLGGLGIENPTTVENCHYNERD